MRNFWEVQNYMSVTTASTARYGLPIMAKPLFKSFDISTDHYEFQVPGSANLDLEELVAVLSVTAETATAPTISLTLEEDADPCASYTRINQTAGLAVGGTTLVVDDASAIPNSVFPIMLASFTEVNGVNKLTKYEWCYASGKSSNTLTIVRDFYQADQVFSDNDFVFFSNGWGTAKDSANNNIANTGVAINGATASAPVTSRLALSAEGLTGLSKSSFRLAVGAPSAGTATYSVSLSGRTRGLDIA
jgi:hypothetical protein